MEYQIWMEGYQVTGEWGNAQRIWQGEAENFDDAVRKYNEQYSIENPDGKHPAEPYLRGNFVTEEAFQTRRSNWKIWGCALFDNEVEARKSFG